MKTGEFIRTLLVCQITFCVIDCVLVERGRGSYFVEEHKKEEASMVHAHVWQCLIMGVVEPRSIIYYMGEIVDELPVHLRKVASNVVQLADFRRGNSKLSYTKLTTKSRLDPGIL